MQLQSIELIGFKSFPEKTKISFHEGMTGIVGPNGSGKSNVTDAIRWVLGEQSARSLRGKKMEDIIFAGTQNRRQMSYAEVSLVFDNKDHSLNLDFSEVKITRRLYRSGESEYRINGSLCRLKDLQSLFWDTGLGKDGYSIIGQGRVDELLSAKSEDRRRVFEEAAGISKYRIKKEESIRKLEQTDENLARLNDILNEVENQIPPLEKQAKLANEYLTHKENLQNVEIALFLYRIREIEEAYQEQNNILAAYTEDYAENLAFSEKLTAKLEEEQNKLTLNEQKLQELWEEKADKAQIWEAHQGKKALLEQERTHLLTQIKNLEDQTLQENQEDSYLQDELARKKQEKNSLTQEIEANEKLLSENNEKHSEFISSLSLDIEQYNLVKKEYEQAQDLYYKNRELSTEASLNFKSLQEQLELVNKESANEEELIALDNKLHLLKQEMANILQQKDKLQNRYDNCQNDLAVIRKNLENIELQQAKSEKLLHQLNFEHSKEENWLKNYEGYSYTVKQLMLNLQKAKYPQIKTHSVLGTVADTIYCEAEYTTAIDIALGNILQNVVVDTQASAQQLIEILKRENLGRATFLPVDSLSVKVVEDSYLAMLKEEKGFISLASDLIKINANVIDNKLLKDEQARLLKNYLLGRVIIAGDLNDARRIFKVIKGKFKIVTLAGDVIQAGGAITGGSLKNNSSQIFSRHHKINELQEKINQETHLLTEANTKLVQEKLNFEKKGEELETIFQEKQKVEAENIRITADYNHTLQFKVLKEQLVLEEKNKKQSIEQKISEAQKNALKYLAETTKYQNQLNNLKEKLQNSEKNKEKTNEFLEKLRIENTEIKIKKQTLAERLNACLDWLAKLEMEVSQKNLEKEHRKDSLALAKSDYEQINTNLNLWDLKKQELLNEQQKWQQIYDNYWQAIQNIKNDMQALQLKIDENNKSNQNLFQAKVKFTEKIERMKEQRNILKLDLWNNYSLTYDNCLGVVKKYEEAGQQEEQIEQNRQDYPQWITELNNLDEKKAHKEVTVLKNKIAALGPVNLDSIEALKIVNERYLFLQEQQNDIILAKEELQSIIYKLNKDMKEIFGQNFAAIKKSFQESFRALFGGGEALLELEEPDKVLESAIDIKVCPPGKKLQNMLLLSGGERALSAIALLFALLSQRPAPFVILDEIEAALDEANVHRFASYIKECANQSQFILVTHRKGTMEICDRIYGVTMQEKGVSKLLSLDLQN